MMAPIEIELELGEITTNTGWAITRLFPWKKGETLLLYGNRPVASFPDYETAKIVAETMRRSNVEIGAPNDTPR